MNKSLVLVAVGLALLGLKSFLLSSFGGRGFVWDTWDAELATLYLPYANGDLGWQHLVAPVNEHRIVFTRLVLLALYELAGGWEPLAGMIFNALLHVIFFLAFTSLLWDAAKPEHRAVLVAFSTVVLAVPIGVENLLMGMNTHFYALLLFSFLGVSQAGRGAAFSGRWFVGFFAFLFGGMTMGSSALAPFAGAFTAALQILVGARRRSVPEVLGCAVLLVLTVALLMTGVAVPGHEQYRAGSVLELINAFIQVAAIPLLTFGGALFVHLPLVWLSWYMMRKVPPLNSAVWGVFAFAIWIGGQMLALSYTRSDTVASLRYIDIIICLLPINALAATMWLSQARLAGLFKAARAYLVVWMAVIPALVLVEGYFGPGEAIRNWKATTDRVEQAISSYLQTGMPDDILAFGSLIHPDPNRVVSLLSDPEVRSVLPLPMGTSTPQRSAITALLKSSLEYWPAMIGLSVGILLAGAFCSAAFRRKMKT